MASTSQTDHPTMRRMVRDGLAPRAPAARGGANASDYYSDRELPSSSSIEQDVTQSIRSIERVVENFGVLKENFHFYKDLVGELRAKLDDEKAQREDMDRELAAMERTLKAERDRATRAENSAKASESAIRDLEQQLTSLQAQTARLVKAIALLASTDTDVRGDEDGSLRLVS